MLMKLLRPMPALAGLAIMFMTIEAGAADRPDSFADQVERLSPAVVNISTTTIVSEGPAMDMPQFPPGSPFEDFFKNFGDNDRKRRAASLGSGFIIDEAGIVVTNFHVIENAEEITVKLADETTFTATVLGQDQKTDIAVLKIDPGDVDLTAVPFGDSDNLRVGDWVLAIGNPFGLGGTVITALCCFTPLLVYVFGFLGISGLIFYLDFILLPALGLFILLTALAFWRQRNR